MGWHYIDFRPIIRFSWSNTNLSHVRGTENPSVFHIAVEVGLGRLFFAHIA